MAQSKKVLVIGTGTIGEPLIGLFSRLQDQLAIDEVIFHKRTPLLHECPKVNSLVQDGAKLAVDKECVQDFLALGHEPDYTTQEAMEEATVIVDCTPAGNENKPTYQKLLDKHPKKYFIAQGSEKGFGVPYALGINDSKLLSSKSHFVQVVSCNTHTISRLLKAMTDDDYHSMLLGDFVCIRRANDISQEHGFVPSVVCDKHKDPKFGTHHARDVNDLFGLPATLPIYSSALKSNTQYMHTVRFSFLMHGHYEYKEIYERLLQDQHIAFTEKKMTNLVFSFGRDHGFYGRLYNQAVVCRPTLSVTEVGLITKVSGFAFTPQDGNSLLSSVSATLFGLHGKKYKEYMQPLFKFIRKEV
jgi:glyceraldehyde-3-phosphate dehydrogenase (NAD(P))